MALDPGFLKRPIAHRGYHNRAAGVIENSPSAFAAAIEAGYGIELDIQASSDGEAMVFHYYELDHLTDEAGMVNQRSSAELRAITLPARTASTTRPKRWSRLRGAFPDRNQGPRRGSWPY